MGAILAAWAPSNPTDVGSVPKGVATLFFFEQRAVQDLGVAPLFWTWPSKTTVWLAYKTASPGAPRGPCSPVRFECTGVGSCAWGVMPSPLHAVRMKRCGHLVPF